jgi:hypothetical protein
MAARVAKAGFLSNAIAGRGLAGILIALKSLFARFLAKSKK